MSSLSDTKSKTLGAISAIQTLLERYPVLSSIDSIGGNTSFSFMLDVLAILGVSETDIIEWVAKLLAGKGTDGFLYVLENTLKAALLANVKNMFTCSINPLLPDWLMDYTTNTSNQVVGQKGIELNLNAIDLYGTLNNCPSNREGGVFYFDAYESINKDEETGFEANTPFYHPNDLWKSTDFNAFLWYVINKGTSVNGQKSKLMWDNRVKYIDTFKEYPSLKTEFFNAHGSDIDPNPTISYGSNKKANKKEIIYCEYVERSSELNGGTDILKIWLNSKRYYQTRTLKIKNLQYRMNKTIFEFNYDYIYSLKLFDSKTLVANIVNALLGISANISLNYSIMEEVVAGKIGSIVKNIIESDDTEVDDCFFSFSNEEYDRLLSEATKKHNGTYTYNDTEIDVDYSSILDSINSISDAATLNEQITAISNVFTDVSVTLAQNGEVYSKDQFSFGLDIIYKLLEETITQIVMQVLSPKVAILFKVNSIVMGDIDPQSETWKSDIFNSWEAFIKNFQNLIVALVKELKDLILQQLYKWLMSQIQPLLQLFVSKILLETINDYRTLLKQLVSSCVLPILNGGSSADTYIDNVNYADIVPTQTKPSSSC
jgi:hypothetical protein